MHGRHHDHNRFYVEFTRAGDMMMHCFSQQCAEPLKLGQWVSDVRQLLDADVWGPTKPVNPRLLDTLMELNQSIYQSIYILCLWDSSGESTDNNWENSIH